MECGNLPAGRKPVSCLKDIGPNAIEQDNYFPDSRSRRSTTMQCIVDLSRSIASRELAQVLLLRCIVFPQCLKELALPTVNLPIDALIFLWRNRCFEWL